MLSFMFGRKKLLRENERLRTELADANATIHKQKRQLRKFTNASQPTSKRPQHNYISRDARGHGSAPAIERGFVYLWLQKVACSSVKDALLPLFDLNPDPYKRRLADGRLHYIVHDVFRDSDYSIPREQFLERGKYEDHFKFAFVRNPFDRLVSCYNDKINRAKVPGWMLASGRQGGVEFYARMPFKEFACAVCQIPPNLANGHFKPQYLTICDDDGKLAADFVGHFESLAADFDHVKREIGAPDLTLGDRNVKAPAKAPTAGYREYYDDYLRDLVGGYYERDLLMFGYSF